MARAEPATLALMLRGAFALSLRRLLRSQVILANLALAAIPVALGLIVYAATRDIPEIDSMTKVNATLEWFLRLLYLHFVVFFMANILGFSVMRQEREEQTLHYLFLQPVRRWMIVAAKFAAYLLVATALCVGSYWAAWAALGAVAVGPGAVVAELAGAGRGWIMIKESLVLVLGLLAYGSLALMMGHFFKNAVYSLILLGWEAGLPYLPSTLKFWTLSHYLQSLLPVRLAEQKNLFELMGEPASTTASLAVLLIVPAIFVGLSVWIFRHRECLYGEP